MHKVAARLRGMLLIAPLLVLPALPFALSGLVLRVYNNTAMADPPCATSELEALELSLPGGAPLSLEVTGTAEAVSRIR